jgi:hypothetical protein
MIDNFNYILYSHLKGGTMNFSHQKKMERLSQVSIRIPASIKHRVRMIAEESTDEEPLTESDIYRFIIVNFFANEDTNCIQSGLQIVSDQEAHQ